MRNHFLGTAVAVALGTVAGSASAFVPASDPNGYPLTLAGYYEVVFSGATSSSNSVRYWIIDRVCDTTSPVDVYRRYTTSYSNDWAVGCTIRTLQDADGDGIVDAGETVAAKQVLFRKRDVGGSGWGVTPVMHPMNVAPGSAATIGFDSVNPGGTATGFKVDVMSVTVGAGAGFNCNTDPGTGGFAPAAMATGAGRTFTEYRCGTANVQRVPDAGFSDIEPNKFFGINTPSGLPAYATSTAVDINTFGALVFGTTVTKDLRNALQAVQFPLVGTNSDCNPATPSYNLVQAETERCMPDLNKTTITSLFTGGIQNWNKLLVGSTSLTTHSNVVNAQTAGYLTIPVDKKVQICRRVNGGQAQFNAIFTNWPCDPAATTAFPAPGNCLLGPCVAENSGSSDVSKCLDDFNGDSNGVGTNTSTKNPGLVARWAIGIQSTENNTDLEFDYRYIKLDGSAPTIKNTANACYKNYAEASFQYRTNSMTLLNATLAADKSDTLVVLAHMAGQSNTPNDTAIINTNFVHTWGQGGWLVTPGGFGGSIPFDVNNPVSSVTRMPFGKAMNICNSSIAIKEIPIEPCCQQ